jgi:serine/threonine-protein kinase
MGLSGILKAFLQGSKTDIAARYEILREAVSGTMSKFYKARDRETGQLVGLKVLDKEKTAALEARFKGLNKPNEGEIAVSLDHPQIVKTYAFGTSIKGELFLVMEFLDGPGLNSLIIAQHPELEGKRLLFLRQAAESLAGVHSAGYIHRDICPRNFVANETITSLKLIDFGLTVPATSPFMQPGNRTGTPNYMSPEVVRRRPTDQRLDIFSFGVSAYELLTGNLPWKRGSDGMAAMAHDTKEPVPIEQYRPSIDPTLANAVTQCLASDPADRPQTMERFLQSIRSVKHEDRR